MSLSRREFLRITGMATLTAALPLSIGKRSAAAAPPPGRVPTRYTARLMGANIKLWAFGRNRTARQRQIQKVLEWGFEGLRDNEPFGMVPQYDMNHAKAVAEELAEQGISYLFTGADRTPGVENFVSPSTWAAIRQRYPDVGDSRRCLTAIATGSNMRSLNEFMLDHVQILRNLMPSNARMQAFNGPELLGYLKWNMFDPAFRQWVRSIGLQAPDNDAEVWANYRSFRDQMKQIWGSEWVYESSHVYAYDGPIGQAVYFAPWPGGNPVITELGVSLYAVDNPPSWWDRVIDETVQYWASLGLQWTGRDRYLYNVEEFYIHSAVDPRFFDLWLSDETEALWDQSLYQQLLDRMRGTDRQGFPEYDAVMLHPGMEAAVLQMMDRYRSNRGTYEPPLPPHPEWDENELGALPRDGAIGGAGGQSIERGYGTGSPGSGAGGGDPTTPRGAPAPKPGGGGTPVEKLGGGR